MTGPFDLVVIGGGINGTGIARDAALRGLAVCLVEQADLCNATTRWSSRLIHGGLRYLEHGELGLVYESLTERERLLRNAGHLVRPLPLLIPVWKNIGRGLNAIDFGLWVYDTLSIGRSVPGHRRLSRDEALGQVPALAPEGLTGGALYYDAQVTHVERLVVENALAARLAGAVIRTYTQATGIILDDGRIAGVEIQEVLTGARDRLEARVVINATGPWVDRLLGQVPRSIPRFLGPTKGSHIVLPVFPGFQDVACYVEARSDRRPFFILPWDGRVLIGTTDLRYEGDPAAVSAGDAEIDYLLAETRTAFPDCGLTRDHIQYVYAGVRPLPRQGLRDNAAITRRHAIRHHAQARGLYSVIGGKITTYRHLAEEAVDLVLGRLGRTADACTTADRPLPGGGATRDSVLRELAQYASVPAQAHEHLWSTYGKRAPQVAALARELPDLCAVICPFSKAIGAEVVFALNTELATTLADVLFRRCMAGLAPDLGAAALSAALPIAQAHLHWSEQRLAEERQLWAAEAADLRRR